MSARPALVRQHLERTHAGLLGRWAAQRGLPLEIHRTDLGLPEPDLDGRPFVVSLGSPHSPLDAGVPAVRAELDGLARAVAAGVPVLGLCYGAQALAVVLGGSVEPAPEAELGWHEVETDDPGLVPAGPWIQWHRIRFRVPPGATELARSPVGPQAYTQGPHLGVQFHPETTIEIASAWAAAERDRIAAEGRGDAVALLERGRHHAAPAARAAFELFDAFLARTRTSRGAVS